jgi:hypothetical protein
LDDADFRSGRVEIEHLPKDISQKVGAGAAPCHPWVGGVANAAVIGNFQWQTLEQRPP